MLHYKQYMNSKEWRAKRRQALNHHGYFCHKCQSVKRLVVHHLTYDRFGQELMEDLQILCEDCHNIIHGGSPRRKKKRKVRFAGMYRPWIKADRATLAKIDSLKTGSGGWTRRALEKLGVPWPPPKGWRKRLEGR